MSMNNNSGIGFKVFGLFLLFAVAIFIDITIFSGGIDIEDMLYDLNEILDEAYYDEEKYTTQCDYEFVYLDNDNYKLWNKSNVNSMIFKIYNLHKDIYDTVEGSLYVPDNMLFEYKINYCDETIEFDKNMKYIRHISSYEDVVYDATPYRDVLNEIVENGILSDSLVHFYEMNHERTMYDLELSYEDANRVKELWEESKYNIINSNANTKADYMLTVGNDFIIFDSFSGKVFYNGHHVQVPLEMMNILWEYI